MSSLPSHVVEQDDVSTAAQFILLCKRGDANAAAAFLRRTLAEVDGSALDLSMLTSTIGYDLIGSETKGFNDTNGGVQPITFIGDELDKQNATLIMLIPGDMHVVGHLIGKGGLEIGKIENESGAAIKIEAQSHIMSNSPQIPSGAAVAGLSNTLANGVGNGQQNERLVTISGTVISCVKAQRLLDKRLRARLESDGIHREVLRIIVPNDFVRHLIGKGGSNISQLQAQTGIRIQVQAEANMAPNQLGRVVTFQGAEYGRTIAQYLVARQICEGPFRDWPQQQPQTTPQPMSPTTLSSSWSASLHSGNIPPDWTFMEPPKPVPLPPARDPVGPGGSPSLSPSGASRHLSNPFMSSGLSQSPPSTNSDFDGVLYSDSHIISNRVGSGPLSDDDQLAGVPSAAIQLRVPNVAVAFLIGRGGSTVGEMEQKSGARIRFSKQVMGEQSRVVEIKGSAVAVRNAHALVQARMDAYFSNHSHVTSSLT